MGKNKKHKKANSGIVVIDGKATIVSNNNEEYDLNAELDALMMRQALGLSDDVCDEITTPFTDDDNLMIDTDECDELEFSENESYNSIKDKLINKDIISDIKVEGIEFKVAPMFGYCNITDSVTGISYYYGNIGFGINEESELTEDEINTTTQLLKVFIMSTMIPTAIYAFDEFDDNLGLKFNPNEYCVIASHGYYLVYKYNLKEFEAFIDAMKSVCDDNQEIMSSYLRLIHTIDKNAGRLSYIDDEELIGALHKTVFNTVNADILRASGEITQVPEEDAVDVYIYEQFYRVLCDIVECFEIDEDDDDDDDLDDLLNSTDLFEDDDEFEEDEDDNEVITADEEDEQVITSDDDEDIDDDDAVCAVDEDANSDEFDFSDIVTDDDKEAADSNNLVVDVIHK